jgi:hypothetical protein
MHNINVEYDACLKRYFMEGTMLDVIGRTHAVMVDFATLAECDKLLDEQRALQRKFSVRYIGIQSQYHYNGKNPK